MRTQISYFSEQECYKYINIIIIQSVVSQTGNLKVLHSNSGFAREFL